MTFENLQGPFVAVYKADDQGKPYFAIETVETGEQILGDLYESSEAIADLFAASLDLLGSLKTLLARSEYEYSQFLENCDQHADSDTIQAWRMENEQAKRAIAAAGEKA